MTLAALLTVIVTGLRTVALSVFVAVAQTVSMHMLFVVQHTQKRAQRVTHRKLDELLPATNADDRLLRFEEAPDAVMDDGPQRHGRRRQQAHQSARDRT